VVSEPQDLGHRPRPPTWPGPSAGCSRLEHERIGVGAVTAEIDMQLQVGEPADAVLLVGLGALLLLGTQRTQRVLRCDPHSWASAPSRADRAGEPGLPGPRARMVGSPTTASVPTPRPAPPHAQGGN
jgi:hypothetical protein